MTLAQSLLAVTLLFFALERKFITDYALIVYLMLVVFVFSLFPSLSIPYIIDDVNHFHNLAEAINSHLIIQWLFTPHNEHVMPFIKAIYLFCYHCFWLDPEFFHLIVLAVIGGIIVLIYKLIFVLTKNPLAALIGGSIMAATNLTDDAMFIGTNSHIFFCMFFFLLLFYGLYQYAAQQKSVWRWAAFLVILIIPSTFALGLTSIFFVPLFYFLCIPRDLRPNVKKLFPLLLTGWLLSLIPYVCSMNAIIHTDHYKDIGAHSIFGVIRVIAPTFNLCYFVAVKLIPCVFTMPYLAYGLFFICIFTVLAYTNEIVWKRVLFFVLFGLFNNFIIFIFRNAWGVEKLDTARYYVFPIVMIAFCYPFLLDIYIKHTPQIKRASIILVVYLLCFFAVVNGGLNRYENGNMLLRRTLMMQNLYTNFRKAFVDYFQEHQSLKSLKFRDGVISLPDIQWPLSKAPWPISRYRYVPKSFYAAYILPASINKKIIWASKTDPDFLTYLNAHEYFFLSTELNND